MPSIARLQRTSHAADSATETPSKTRRDFFLRRRDQRISFRESIRERDSTESPCRRFPPRACFLADLQPQSSANKEQRLRIWESKNFTWGAYVPRMFRRLAENKRPCSERSLPHGRVRDREGAIANTRGASGPRKKEKSAERIFTSRRRFSGGELLRRYFVPAWKSM